jgi:hypothetical protein
MEPGFQTRLNGTGNPGWRNAMPDIRIKATGQTFYQVDPLLAQIFCAALPDQIERVAAPQVEQPGVPAFKKPATPEWKIGRLPHDRTLFLQLTTPLIGEVVKWTGEPDDAPAYFELYYKQHGPIPAAALAAYRAERDNPGSTQPTRQQQLEADAARMREFMKGREPSTSWLDGGK